MALFRNSKGILRLLGFYALLYLLVTPVLGLLFAAMLFPLMLAFLRLSFVYTPAYHVMGRIMGVSGLPERLAKPSKWLGIYSWVYVIFWVAVALLFFWPLFMIGFCNQNVICFVGRWLLK